MTVVSSSIRTRKQKDPHYQTIFSMQEHNSTALFKKMKQKDGKKYKEKTEDRQHTDSNT